MVNSLEKLYSKIINKATIINETNSSNWTISDTLSYIVYKYKEKFKLDFIFSFNNVPSKSIEYKMTSRIWLMLGAKSGDANLVKDYIDWFYDNYNSKRKFTSLGALAKPDLILKYKESNVKVIKNTTLLPNYILEEMKQLEESSYIKTYGDLYFFFESLHLDEELKNKFSVVEENLIIKGFDFKVLKSQLEV